MDIYKMGSQDLQELIERGRKLGVSSVSKEIITAKKYFPQWLDPEAIKDGQNFVRRHLFVIFFSHFISLILLLCYVPVRSILLLTKRSHTKELSLKRYLSTLQHVQFWYEGDLTTPEGNAVRDILKIRRIHNGVSSRIGQVKYDKDLIKQQVRDELSEEKVKRILRSITKCFSDDNNNKICRGVEKESETKPLFVSQLDMIVTQYCFMGLLTSFPQKFGISLQDKKGLEGFIHLWAVIGHLLGIEDEFNLCIGEKRNLKQYILNEILLSQLADTKFETVILWESLVSAMGTFIPCLSTHAALLYILNHTLNIKKSSFVFDETTYYERFCYNLMVAIIMQFFEIDSIKCVFNNLLRFAIFLISLKLTLTKVINKFCMMVTV